MHCSVCKKMHQHMNTKGGLEDVCLYVVVVETVIYNFTIHAKTSNLNWNACGISTVGVLSLEVQRIVRRHEKRYPFIFLCCLQAHTFTQSSTFSFWRKDETVNILVFQSFNVRVILNY